MNKGLALLILIFLLIVTILLSTQSPPETSQSVSTSDPAVTSVNIELNATSTGEIILYEDPNVTIPLTPINWGTLRPGRTHNRTIYIANGDNQSWILTVRTANWTPPEVEQYINFSMANTTLKPLAVTPVTFTLTVTYNISNITKFNFNIWLRVD